MADQTRKDPKQSPETKDLPPKKVTKTDGDRVKGGRAGEGHKIGE